MNIFKNNLRKHYFLELFKITDQTSASQFDTQDLVLQSVELLEKLTKEKANHFSLNYSNSGSKTIRGFKSQYQKSKEIVQCYVDFNSNKTKTYFTVSNSILNYENDSKRPEKSLIDISFQINQSLITKEEIENLAEELIQSFSFDYGYIHEFPTNKYHGEKKMKKGLFSTSIDIDKIDLLWKNHQIEIMNGYIKKLYFINYLNQSQITNKAIKELIQSNGVCAQVSDTIFKWEVEPKEHQELLKNEELLDTCIVSKESRFLSFDTK
ncbi:hypothetical protein KMW28_23435 [Flammeovirga yaeyamensis]|uniref:Uncharacterized protein n=1 Tax=Flammeovirga yaeyamensis TaxID=367791 RepID=A0AAX1NE57_9BACT|nr:hypothetical protein [Flammeovirga yaeyamensis]MBB3696675.1 hypothetical protein [Flammeovirga yaeyamensis]NMF33348.1 hypothetical protein [Flammeovirga yaeyamensis]QWG05376.1 hypothetical protein KMW28_23435 [Flammeovirga yaeyamensis]